MSASQMRASHHRLKLTVTANERLRLPIELQRRITPPLDSINSSHTAPRDSRNNVAAKDTS
jgi:hypothetical protein